MDEKLKNSIANVNHFDNDPDEIYFLGQEFNFRKSDTVPFMRIQMPDMDKKEIVFGEPRRSHNLIRGEIIESYLYGSYTNAELKKMFNEYIIEEVGDIKRGIYGYISEHEENGRYFIINYNDKTYCILAFWIVNSEYSDAEYDASNSYVTDYVNELLVKVPTLKECDMILIANGTEPFYVYKGDGTDNITLKDNSAGLVLHNLSAQDKWDNTQFFRDTREKKLGDMLTQKDDDGKKTGKEMTLAQYNSLRYVDESKKTHKRIFLTESQYNNLQESFFDAIKRKKKHNGRIHSMRDKISLVNDKNIVDGGNFPIKRNGKIYWVSRSTTVGVYVFCRDKNGVLCTVASKRGPNVHCQQNQWNAPCGYLEHGDSIKETAVKECWEETGIRIPIEKLVYLGENSEYSRRGDVKHTFYCVLDGDISQYQPSIENCEPGEATDARWIPLNQLKDYNFVGRQARNLYEVGTKLLHSEKAYAKNKDYMNILQSLENMKNEGIISDEQIIRVKNTLNI